MDGLLYDINGEAHDGLVQSVLRSTSFKKHRFLLVRRLNETSPPFGNVLETTKYNQGVLQIFRQLSRRCTTIHGTCRAVQNETYLVMDDYNSKVVL